MTRKPTRPSHLKALETPVAVDGKAIATDLLSSLDSSTRNRILSEMRNREPGLTREIEGRLTTLLKVLELPQAAFQQVWAHFPETTWCTALRGATSEELESLKKKLSARALAVFLDATQNLGPKPKSAVDEARRLIIEFAKANNRELA